ncbi:MAG: hypothetical protein WCY21_02530 [Candidatus Cloacimonadaceae bacterium]|jgi:tetratricopeptide (TPR) repeat protein|nr:hypothetical protein [Candidatus Cloacimonadota bacterium]MDX9949669.1 hypothetical protein [Candidatus Syntrophosphaera sp.]
MKKTAYLSVLLLALFLAMAACSANKKIEIPEEPEPTALELADMASLEASDAFEDEDFHGALELFNQAKDYYIQAQPLAVPTDSVDVKIEKTQINIAVTYMRMANESVQAEFHSDAIDEFESAANIYKSLTPLTMTAQERDEFVSYLYQNLAVTAQNASHFEQALGYYDNVLHYEPGNADVLMSKYSILKNDIHDQVRAYKVLADYAEASQDPNAYIVLANAYQDEGDNNTAAVYYEQAMNLGKNVDVYTRAADFYRNIKNYTKSNEILNKLVDIAPDNASKALAYRIMADNYDKLKNNSKKVEFYDKALNLEPNADVALILANHWNQNKSWDKVITYATKVINIDSSKAAAFLLRGNAYLMKKNNAAAKTDLQRIQNDPNYGKSATELLKKIK